MTTTPFDYCQWMRESAEMARQQEEQLQQETALREQRRALFAKLRQEEQTSDQLFLETSGKIIFAKDAKVTSRDLYEHYSHWCTQRGYTPKSQKELCGYLCRNAQHYRIRHSTNIPTEEGKRLRGFLGMSLADDTDTLTFSAEAQNIRV